MALLVDYIQLDKFSPDPETPEDGYLWYNEDTDTIKIRAENITRSLVDEFLFTTHTGSLVNPHDVTPAQIGLGNVTNDPQLLRAGNDFSLFVEKVTPVSADILLIEDSADSGNKKKVQIGNLPGGSSGITEGQHEVLRQLIHFIDDGPAGGFVSGAYKETLPSANPFPTSEIWYESSAKTQKIVEVTITRNPNKTPATEEWKIYDEDGSTVLTTVTDTISYSGIFETSRTRTIV